MTRIGTRFFVSLFIAAFFVTCASLPAARASVIDTSSYLQQQDNPLRAELQGLLVREDVRSQLMEFGVSPDDARKRVASLTDQELIMLQKRIDELPAGSSALAIIGGVFLVLLILELVGITNIFNRV